MNGVWSGNVSLASTGPLIQLGAATTSGAEISGFSNTFTVSSPSTPPLLPFTETWESGAASSAWVIDGTGSYRTQITTNYTPHGGTRHLTMDSSSSSSYSRNEATLTIDLAGRTSVVLNFWAKGFAEEPHAPATNPFTNGADFDGVAISMDGITWYEVQPLRSPALTNDWKQFTVNLDAVMTAHGLAYTSAFRVRFNRYGNNWISSDGIAIDDISVTTSAGGVPVVTLPASAVESSSPVTGTISLPSALPDDIVFTLSSSAPAKLALPATVTLPAGQTSVAFIASPIDDTLFDGSHTLVVTVSPPTGRNLANGATTLVLTDDDVPAITLTVTPASVAENASAATATVTLGAVPSAPVSLTLASSDPTAATVPATLSFEPGQTTTTFLVTPVNDTKIDGPQTTTLSASLPGATPGTAPFTVTDNETTTLTLTISSSITEGSSGNRTVGISGTLAEPLTISLSSSNPAQLTVPTTVSIPAGSTSVSFAATAVDDTNTDGTVTVQITATASGFTGVSANVSVVDNDLHHFTFSTISSPQIANRPFTVFAYARTIDESSVPYTGTVPLSAQSTGGNSISLTPSTLTFFGNSGSASISLLAPASGVTLRMDDGAGHTGASNSFDVGTGAINRFHVSTLAPHQSVGVATSVTLTAQDSYGNTVTGFTGSAALSAGPGPTFTGTGTPNSSSFPMNSYSEDSRTQAIYTAAEIGAAGPLTSLALNIITTPGQVLSNWTIRMKHVSSATAGGWESTGWTTVHQSSADLTAASPGWIEFPFTTPFNYDGTSYLMVDFSYNNTAVTGVRTGVVQTTYAPSSRLIYANASSTTGDPLLWSGTTPTASANSYLPNLRITRLGTVPVTPSITPAFTYGTWTGPVTFGSVSASTLTLQALNGNIIGQSNSFDVLPEPLISVSPEDVWTLNGPRGGDFTGQSRTYTLTNISAEPLSWTASSPVAWLAFTPTGGTLAPGAVITVTASPTSAASALASGVTATDLVFAVNGAPNAIRRAELTATPAGALTLSSASGFAPIGLVGGPFFPSSASWTLSNTGDATISWTASKTQTWLSLSTTGGSLAPGATTTVTATLGSSAATLPVSVYTDTITFANTTTGQGNTTRPATLTVRAPVPPVITTHPTGSTLFPYDNAALSVAASGDGTLSYQWYRGNAGDISAPVAGGTSSLLVTPNLTSSSSFWVRVTNFVGATDSAVATVTITPVSSLNLTAAGDNSAGQLGDGSLTQRLSPTRPAIDAVQIAAGKFHNLFVKTDGSLWAMGANSTGRLGDGTTTDRLMAIQVNSNVVQASAGSFHSHFVKTNGTLWAMGHNANGELGDGTTTTRLSPVQIATGVAQVSAGSSHTLFIKLDGTLWATGYNSNGQLGDGTVAKRYSPVQIASGVAQVSAGDSHSLFVKTDGTLWGMGTNSYGQLGDGTTTQRITPVQLASDVRQTSAAIYHSLVIKTEGSLWAMGYNSNGQLGDGTTINRYTPVKIATGVSKASAAWAYSLFIKTDKTLWASGQNSSGQFGNSTNTGSITPTQVDSGIIALSTGYLHSLRLGLKPNIVTQPASSAIFAGQTAVLSIVASGPPPITYQWYLGSGGNTTQPIAGATNASFTIPTLNNTVTYWVRSANVYGSVDSQTGTITVLPLPDTDSDGLPDAWETAHGLDPASSTTANGRLGDPDRDGIPNLLEYAMGLDPNAAAAHPPTTCTPATHPESGLPHLVYTYRRLIYPGALTYTVTTSSNLTTWSAPATTPDVLSIVTNPDGLTETVTLRLNPSLGTGRVFVRVQVDAP
ncbi:MAG: hypothetical protein ABW223_09330 [Rariglobus sp.]